MRINSFLLIAILIFIAWVVQKPVKVVAENEDGSEISITTTIAAEFKKAFRKNIKPVSTSKVKELKDDFNAALETWKYGKI